MLDKLKQTENYKTLIDEE